MMPLPLFFYSIISNAHVVNAVMVFEASFTDEMINFNIIQLQSIANMLGVLFG